MRVSSFFYTRWIFFYFLLFMLIPLVLLPKILEVDAAYAAHGVAQFDIKPSFFPSLYNITPRQHFVYNSNPGVLIQDSLHVINNGKARGTVNIYAADAITSQMGGETFPSDTVLRRDVGAWVTMSNQYITLYPGQSRDIPFTLRIPAHVRPGDHIGGIIADEPDGQSTTSQGAFRSNIKVHTREIIGVLIHLPGPYVQKLNATGISYGTSNGYQSLQIGLANTGTQILHPAGSLRVTDAAGQQRQNVPLTMDAFLPQTSINYPVYIHHTALKPGTYTATLSLKYEGMHTLHYLTSFVVPMPQLTKNAVGSIVSDLVAPDTNFFSELTPWHYVVGISFLFFILSALFFWCQKIFQWKRHRGLMKRNPKNSPAELLEIGSKRTRKGSRTPKD